MATRFTTQTRTNIIAIVFATGITISIIWAYGQFKHNNDAQMLGVDKTFGKASFGDHLIGATGIAVRYYGTEFPSVDFVAEGSAAQSAGVRAYDQIAGIDGVDTRLMTAPEIEEKLRGQPFRPISLALKRYKEGVKLAYFNRGTLSQCRNLTERSTLRLRTKEINIPEENERVFFLPYLFYSARSTKPSSVIFEFYDSKHGPARVPPTIRWSNYWETPKSATSLPPLNPDGLRIVQPQTDVLRFSMDDPIVQAAAAKLNISRAPAYVYQITNSQIVYESRMVKNPGPSVKPIVLQKFPGSKCIQSYEAYGMPAGY